MAEIEEVEKRLGVPGRIRAGREERAFAGCATATGPPPCGRRRRPRPAPARRSTRARRARPATDRPVWIEKAAPGGPPDADSACTHQRPTHSAATETSYDHNGSSCGTHASIQRWFPGSRYTAPPPPLPPRQLDRSRPHGGRHHDPCWLRTAENERGTRGRPGEHDAPPLVTEPLDVEERLRRRRRVRRGRGSGQTSGRRSQIRLPQRVDVREVPQPPEVPVGRRRLDPERPAQLREQLVGLDRGCRACTRPPRWTSRASRPGCAGSRGRSCRPAGSSRRTARRRAAGPSAG